LKIYVKDFDNNGSLDAVITTFLKDPLGVKREYTAFNRDDIVNQLPGLRKQFPSYKDFANADIAQLFTAQQLQGAYTLHANNLKSCFIKNLGNGKFEMHPLPVMAQMAPLYGMVAGDFNNDGNLDIALAGNDFGNEVTNGRYDAFNGLVMLGDGQDNFAPQTISNSGLFLPGDAKAMVRLKGTGNHLLLAASQNRGPLKIFRSRNDALKIIPLKSGDKAIFITLKSGAVRKEEIYYGNAFFSQSSSFVLADASTRKITITGRDGHTREINY